jgi:hypothetical protein
MAGISICGRARVQAVFDGRKPAAAVARTITTPTPKTVQRVMSGVTQKLPMIGEAAIRRAKSHSPGALRAIGRIPAAYSLHH